MAETPICEKFEEIPATPIKYLPGEEELTPEELTDPQNIADNVNDLRDDLRLVIGNLKDEAHQAYSVPEADYIDALLSVLKTAWDGLADAEIAYRQQKQGIV